MHKGHGFGPFLGRFLISLVFLLAGASKIFNFTAATQTLKDVGIDGAAGFAFAGLAFEVIGALMILLGWYTRLGCILLMIFLLPATLIFHAFWDFEGPMRLLQMAMFLKNLTIYGGLVLLITYGPGRWSMDATREGRCPRCE